MQSPFANENFTMKESEFYTRAFEDAAYRHAKLDDLHYAKVVVTGLLWFCLSLGVFFFLYTGLREGRWDAGIGLFASAALSAFGYAMCATQIAALDAFEKNQNRQCQSVSSPLTSHVQLPPP
jgi:hypothetical protein